MSILLFGKDGQVGYELQRTLLPLGPVSGLGRAQADLEDLDALRGTLQRHAPRIIVNAAAYTAVDKAESDTGRAQAINADAVGIMARHAADTGALLVHYSTDYVFNGRQESPYSETDPTDPVNAYGATKLAGEQAIADSGCDSLVFRTSWVFSAHGANFIKTILRLARERDSLSIVADQIGAPTSAELIADVTALAIAARRRDSIAPGLYHLTASGETSWYGLACHALAQFQAHGMTLRLAPQQVRAIGTSDYPLPAARPANSRLSTEKLSQALGLSLPDWTVHANRALSQLSLSETA